jgi:hypothetical protein
VPVSSVETSHGTDFRNTDVTHSRRNLRAREVVSANPLRLRYEVRSGVRPLDT